MSRLTLILILLLPCLTILKAQESEKYLKYKNDSDYKEGYIIKNDSAKVKGLIQVTDRNKARIFGYIIFITEDGLKQKYTPSKILNFGYGKYVFESAKRSFYQLVRSTSNCNIYRRVFRKPLDSSGRLRSFPNYEVYYLKKRGSTNFTKLTPSNFKKRVLEHFDHCPEIISAIKDKELRFRNRQFLFYGSLKCL